MPEIDQTVSHYRIVEKIGQGGMGEVYLADDTTLDRKVALKFLPEAFAIDPERMARFEREAKLLASLNHPNIAGIHGLEEADGNRFLVLEYVEGETLKAKLSKGALPLEDALALCRQIAAGLEAAHEKGVIHRDLKPANVMIMAEEKVKILDFGLAKALTDESQKVDPSDSPTITEGITRPGVVLGTAAYMSPEQAKGKSVDKRADIWAFGCIFYECLTGKKAFAGETVTETLAAVIKEEPDLETAPAKARALLRRCLEKDAKKRLRDIGEAMAWIEVVPESGLESVPVKPPWLAWSVATLATLITIALAWVYFGEKEILPDELMRFQIGYPGNVSPGISNYAISPNGRYLAFCAAESDGIWQVYLRELKSLEIQPLSGTESERDFMLFWSPDSRFIAFEAGRKLKKINIAGGPATTICDLSGSAIGGAWNRDDVIIFGDYNASNGIVRVEVPSGRVSPVTRPDPKREEDNHIFPAFLPDGRHFLYFCNSDIAENAGVFIGSLDAKPEEQDAKQLMTTSWAASYVHPGNLLMGQLLFLRGQTLMAQSFDDKRLELVGDPVPIADNVGYYRNSGFFSASMNDRLIYRGSFGQPSQYTWFSRKGEIIGTEENIGVFGGVALSPDGTQAAISWEGSPHTSVSPDIWLLDLIRGTNTRFTFGDSQGINPIWSPDGNHIVYSSRNMGGGHNLYIKLASGAQNEELLLKSKLLNKQPTSWSSDGRFLLYTANYPKTREDLWILPMENKGEEIPLLIGDFNERNGRFSPDMRWIAYVSDESGRNEIYISGFNQSTNLKSPEMIGRWQISREGGSDPRWREDSKELFFRAPDGKVMAAEISLDTVFPADIPEQLFQVPVVIRLLSSTLEFSTWDVSADGQRFLLPTPVEESSSSPFTVILNWTHLLEQ